MCSLMHHSRSLPCDKLKINLAKSVPLPPKTSHPVKELATTHAVYQSVLNNGISLAGNWKKHGKDVKKKQSDLDYYMVMRRRVLLHLPLLLFKLNFVFIQVV